MAIKVVTFGGGTGQPVVLRALKMLPDIGITAVVSMADSGGSSGVLRDERGILPPSDALRCLLALADEEDSRVADLVDLCRHRFEGDGSLVPGGVGHTVGNVMMAGLIERYGMVEALRCMGRQLGVPSIHQVLPSTLAHTTLCAELEDGTQIHGETLIDRPDFDGRAPIKRVWLEPNALTIPEVAFTLARAPYAIVCMGDLYTSTIAALLPQGIAGALQGFGGHLVLLVNAMTKQGETDGYTVSRHIGVVEQYLGRRADIVVCNTGRPNAEILARYTEEGGAPVVVDVPNSRWDGRTIVKADLLAAGELARHNPILLAVVLGQRLGLRRLAVPQVAAVRA